MRATVLPLDRLRTQTDVFLTKKLGLVDKTANIAWARVQLTQLTYYIRVSVQSTSWRTARATLWLGLLTRSHLLYLRLTHTHTHTHTHSLTEQCLVLTTAGNGNTHAQHFITSNNFLRLWRSVVKRDGSPIYIPREL